jgi:3-hydroxyisobutyrate dehydrogenase-like beta-hydroxyacid dehydrogenase
MKRKLGFIGLGKMGKPMAENLLRADFPLTVYNRSPKSVEQLVSQGADPASSPRDVAAKSEIILLSLPSNEAVSQVILGDEGIVKGFAPGGVIADTSTIDPQLAREISSELQPRDIRFLDAPISGGPEGAQNATLTFMIGGTRKDLEACKDILEVLGRNIFYMGKSGAGQAAKLVNQILVASHTVAAADAIRFASAMNLDIEVLQEVIKVSAGDSFVFRRTAPKMIENNFGSGWQISLLCKDLRIIMKTAETKKIPLALTPQTFEIFTKAMNLGLGKVDAASIINL